MVLSRNCEMLATAPLPLAQVEAEGPLYNTPPWLPELAPKMLLLATRVTWPALERQRCVTAFVCTIPYVLVV
jgi:hypothetical protein